MRFKPPSSSRAPRRTPNVQSSAGPRPAPPAVAVRTAGFTAVAVGVCAVLTVVVGVFPGPVLDLFDAVAKFLP